MEQYHNISAINSQRNTEAINNYDMSTVYAIAPIINKIINGVNIKNTSRIVSSYRIISSVEPKEHTESDKIFSQKTLDIGDNDISRPNVFQSSNRHIDVSAEDLSERWCISLKTAQKTLNKTTQKFIRSDLLPLSRRYRADRMFNKKTLTGAWSYDTLDGRTKSLDSDRYAQVFANKQ